MNVRKTEKFWMKERESIGRGGIQELKYAWY